jgi:hypothetical protein
VTDGAYTYNSAVDGMISSGQRITLQGAMFGAVAVSRPKRTSADILEAAAGLMEKYGWCRTLIRNEQRQVCLLGSIILSYPSFLSILESKTAEHFLSDEIFAQTGIEPPSPIKASLIPYWNDLHCRPKEEAVEMLRMAAKRAKAAEVGSE